MTLPTSAGNSAWIIMKDRLFWQGNAEVGGSRDAIRVPFSANILKDGEVWMEMIKSRNQSSLTYNDETAASILSLILHRYHKAFQDFETEMSRRALGS